MLFSEICNLIVLGAVHPASDGEYEKVQRVRHVLRRTLSTLGQQPTRPRQFATLASVALLHHTGPGLVPDTIVSNVQT